VRYALKPCICLCKVQPITIVAINPRKFETLCLCRIAAAGTVGAKRSAVVADSSAAPLGRLVKRCTMLLLLLLLRLVALLPVFRVWSVGFRV